MAALAGRLQLLPFERYEHQKIDHFGTIASNVNSTLYLSCSNANALGFWCIAAAVPHLISTHSSISSCIALVSFKPHSRVLPNNVQHQFLESG